MNLELNQHVGLLKVEIFQDKSITWRFNVVRSWRFQKTSSKVSKLHSSGSYWTKNLVLINNLLKDELTGSRHSPPPYSSISSINYIIFRNPHKIRLSRLKPKEHRCGSWKLYLWIWRAWLRRRTLRPLFRGRTFFLKSSHSYSDSSFEAKRIYVSR